MTNQMPNQSSHFFLPKLKEGSGNQGGVDIKPGMAGSWDEQPVIAFQNVASSLDVPSAGRDVKSVSSIPDMWARPLSMEMALHNNQYPIRAQMIEQWQGMLAAIAFAEVRSFDLKVHLIELGKQQQDPFGRSLYELLPAEGNALYSLPGKNAWEDLYVFYMNKKPVGMTSPSTLVCPSEEGDWTGVPWWSGGKLRSPVGFLNAEERSQFSQWLGNLRDAVKDQGINQSAVNEISRLIGELQTELGAGDSILKLSENKRFFGESLNRGILAALDKPIQAMPRESSIKLMPSFGKGAGQDLLIIPNPERIMQEWNLPPQSIWVQGTTSLASLRLDEIQRSGMYSKWGVRCLLEQDIFQPNFAFVMAENAFPGGVLPENLHDLTEAYEGKTITPLLPLNPVLLDYLSPEELVKNLQINCATKGANVCIEFILDLPLSGVSGNATTSSYRVSREYALEDSVAIAELPVLEIWPNFRSSTWKEYYGFLWSDTQKAFQVSFPGASIDRVFKGIGSVHLPNISISDADSDCQLARMSEFPSYVEARDNQQRSLGLILLKTPREVGTTTGISWLVGVDFGTSFTNVYVNRDESVARLHIEPLHQQITSSNREKRLISMLEYFISDTMDLPLSTILTTRGAQSEEEAILDGRVYFPRDISSFKLHLDDWIRTNLKWEPEKRNHNRLFLKQLALQISAMAAARNAKQIEWAVSFPSAFSKNDRTNYAKSWRLLATELETVTGIKQISPKVENPRTYRTESISVAHYFADYEVPGQKGRLDFVNSTCLDIGGGTSDISIWEENNLIHQCSIQLAGKDLFSQLIQMNLSFLNRNFNIDITDWRKLTGFKFNVKLDIWMKAQSEGWLNNRRELVGDNEEIRGLLRLMSLGICGLYYYIGLLLKALEVEGKYKAAEITPVFVGGNGSRFMHWLSEDGEFNNYCEVNDLLSAMLSQSSGYDDLGANTTLSPLPKDEVACGLVFSDTRLKGLDRRVEDPVFAGESVQIDGEELAWSDRVVLPDEVTELTMPSLAQLRKFVNSFHQSLKSLKIEGISGFPGYEISESSTANEKLWRDVQRKLKDSLLKIRGRTDDVRIEPPFVLGLKALLHVLGNQWAEEWKRK